MNGTSGTLTVHIIDAVQLPVVNHIGKQSPYVVIKLGAARKQSKAHINGHRCPVWGDRFQFVLEGQDTELQVEVYHESKFSGATFIGSAPVSLQLSSTQNVLRRVRIGEAGEVRLQLAFFKTEVPARNPSMAGPNQDALLGQALDNATSFLESMHAGQRSSLSGAPGTNRLASRSQKSMASQAQPEPPQWMYKDRIPPKPIAHGPETPTLVTTPTPAVNGYSSKPALGAGKSSGQDKMSTSPARSFRSKLAHKLGIAAKSQKEGSKAGTHAALDTGPVADMYPQPSLEAVMPRTAATEPNSSRSSQLDSQEAAAPATMSEPSTDKQDDLIDMSDDHLSTSTTGLHSSAGLDLLTAPNNLSSRNSAAWPDQGLPMEPVEAIRYETGDGGQAWLSRWEAQHDRPRRATETSFNLDDDSTQWPQAHRRQTDSYMALPSNQMLPNFVKEPSLKERPLMEAPIANNAEREASSSGSSISHQAHPMVDNSSFYRGGFQLKEWGERKGQLSPGSSPFLGFSSFSDRHEPEKWDVKASHERMRLRMQELSRKITKEPLRFDHQPLMGGTASMTQQDCLPSPTLLEIPMTNNFAKQSGSHGIGSAVSAQELGRQNDQHQQEPEASGRGGAVAEDDSLSVTPRERSGSAPASSSRPAATPSYPTPQYPATNDLSDKFADLDPCNSPPPFASAFNHSREEAALREEPEVVRPQSANHHHRHHRDNSDTPATPRSRAMDSEVSFGDTARIQGNEGALPPMEGAADGPGSFRGIMSPFAEDQTPLESETVDSNGTEQASIVSNPAHMRTKSGGRVPIREIRLEMEAEAPASVRVARPSDSSDSGKPSLQALLSDSKQDWLIDEKDLEIAVDERGKAIKLGSGAFGTVWKGMYDQSTEVAIKYLKYETQKDMDEALFEVAILKKQLHPNILQFLGASIGDGSIQLVTELMAGNLYKALRNGRCTWFKGGKSISKNVASALAFLHKKKVVHLDVKSANILLTSNNVAKLGDLGLSAMVNTDSFVNTLKGLGTLQWASPEVLLGNHPVTSASDVYSFGTVLWEICTGDIPQKPLRRVNLNDPNEAPKEVELLIEQCLCSEPSGRPTMQEAYLILKDL